MKAVLWFSRKEAQPMAQLLDRPFVQHVVEQLVARGISEIDFLVDPAHSSIIALLGDGTRWGIRIDCRRTTTIPDEDDFSSVCNSTSELLLFGDACRLPALPVLEKLGETPVWPAAYFHLNPLQSEWTGWALIPERSLPAFAAEVAKTGNWRGAAQECDLQLAKTVLHEPTIGADSPRNVLDSNRIALEGGYPGLFHDGIERQPGIWMARGVKVSASAVLEAPCYIGEEAWIGDDCRIGPMAVIGRECVVERGSSVCRSVLSQATYLGPELEVADSSVVQNVIYNVRLGAELQIEEEHVVAGLDKGPLVPRWIKLWAAPVLILLCIALVFGFRHTHW